MPHIKPTINDSVIASAKPLLPDELSFEFLVKVLTFGLLNCCGCT